jgi:predicted ferric reductase
MIHGFEFWFNWGIPISFISVIPGFIILAFEKILLLFSSCKYHFEIADVSLSADKEFIMISFLKPNNYSYRNSQYIWINIPEISRFQWHPFTIASLPNSPYLLLMIKRAGDWTGKMLDTMYKAK